MQPATADDSLIGFVLADKYRVIRQIGRGGMGIVYEAEHVTLRKRVAIKLMLEKYAQDGEATARFHREALAASQIGNPHIIDVSDIGTAPDGRSFVVMELLNGLPLSKVIEMTGPLPAWRAVAIMRQVLRAVGAAHAKGIIHRDLKPDNIFIINNGDQQDFAKLLDFGISKVVDASESVAFTKLTSTGVVMGTPLYMAPEQAMGMLTERHVDIYACGVILYEMLAGKPPFEGATYAVLVAKLLTQPAPKLSESRTGLPNTIVMAVQRALEKDSKDRFQTAEQFLMALPGEKSPSMIELAGTLDSASGVVAVSPPTERRVRKKWPVFAMLAAAVAGAAVITFIMLNRQPGEPPVKPAAAPPPSVAPILDTTPPVATTPATPATGILQIKSVPAGATVFINDENKGLTPIEITLVPGRYKVRVENPGYDTIESEEEVREKERSSVVLQLPKASAQATTAKGKGSRGSKPETKKTEKTDTATKPAAAMQPQDPTEDDKKPEKKPEETPKKTGPKAGSKPNPYD